MELQLSRSTPTVFTMRLCRLLFVCLFISGVPIASVSAGGNALDCDKILLTVSGNIDGGENAKMEFNMATLVAMEPTVFISAIAWTPEPVEYTGVRINELLKHVGAKSNQFVALADNNYSFTLSDIDFEKYPIIIAYKKDGEFFGVRELGPLLIMFPFDDFPELLTEKNKGSAVWQLTELRIL